MLASINLSQNIPCEKICYLVQESINRYTIDNPGHTNLVLVLDIKQPINDIEVIPKLPFKEEVVDQQ